MAEKKSNPLKVDAIVARHPKHGFVIDGYVAPHAEEQLRRLGYHRNEHNVLTLPLDLDEKTARNRHERAAQILAVTGHTVVVLPDDQAAALANATTPQAASTVED